MSASNASIESWLYDIENGTAAAARRQILTDARSPVRGRGRADDSRAVAASRSAMAAPMPRVAPVTKAMSPFSMCYLVNV